MSCVTKFHLSVNTKNKYFLFFQIHSFISGDSDNSDKRSQSQMQQSIQTGDKRKRLVTKGCQCLAIAFCHQTVFSVDGWKAACLKALRLLSLLSLSPRGNGGQRSQGGVKSLKPYSLRTGRLTKFFHAEVLEGGVLPSCG